MGGRVERRFVCRDMSTSRSAWRSSMCFSAKAGMSILWGRGRGWSRLGWSGESGGFRNRVGASPLLTPGNALRSDVKLCLSLR